MASGKRIYIQIFMTIFSGIQVILRLLQQELERLQFWYYLREAFMEYAFGMLSGGVIYARNFMTIGSCIQVALRFLPQQFEKLKSWYY
jgi:hypothetical protein